MKGSGVRQHFPQHCVLKECKKPHSENQSRELSIFQTNDEEIKVMEQSYIGVRRYEM